MDKLTITKPDDWHVHLRDGELLGDALRHTARQFARAVVMPNLSPPVTTVAAAKAYAQRIMQACKLLEPSGIGHFEPLMTLYLTDNTPPDEIEKASAAGVTNIALCDATLAKMAQIGVPLLVHGEVTSAQIDLFDREAVFIEEILHPLRLRHPKLRVVFEHITTEQAVDYVMNADTQQLGKIAATITAHHLLYNRNAIFQGGIRPHYYCLPVLKREHHRQALLKAATGDSERFFLGTDSAPHVTRSKEQACGCAGCFTAAQAMELYAKAFDSVGKLQQLEAFASFRGPDFYGLARNTEQVVLEKKPQEVPHQYAFGSEHITPLNAGQILEWTFLG